MDAGRCWVADVDGVAAAYVVVDLVDGVAHVEQVSVHPDHRGQGLGAALLDHVTGWAAEHGHHRLTLTTFADVPWNAPYYERLGFRVLRADELGPALDALMDTEEQHGLRRSERVAMARPT
jgi:GNAT superfamily N-acetyltransferase